MQRTRVDTTSDPTEGSTAPAPRERASRRRRGIRRFAQSRPLVGLLSTVAATTSAQPASAYSISGMLVCTAASPSASIQGPTPIDNSSSTYIWVRWYWYNTSTGGWNHFLAPQGQHVNYPGSGYSSWDYGPDYWVAAYIHVWTPGIGWGGYWATTPTIGAQLCMSGYEGQGSL